MTAYLLNIVPATWGVALFSGDLGEFLTSAQSRAAYAKLFATVYTLMVDSLLLRVFSG
jgi:hypothetical protein